MKSYKAAIVGLGQIGQGYDYGLAANEYVKTHATALFSHPGFHLVGGVDPDERQREKFTSKFSCPAFGSVGELLAKTEPEVVALAVPTPIHCAVFEEVIKSRPKALVCEKPLAETLEEARGMVQAAKDGNCALMVNYGRRFDPSVHTLKAAIDGGDFGRIYKGVVWYSKGLRNNGSHFIDLLGFLLGTAGDVRGIASGRCLKGGDPEPDFTIRFGDARITFLAVREECFSHCEMELIGTGGCVKYLQSGAVIDMKRAVPHPQYPGYRSLEAQGRILKDCLGKVQLHCYNRLYDHLAQGKPLMSDGRSALATLTILDAIIQAREKDRQKETL